jgi:SulP family sulfate permease
VVAFSRSNSNLVGLFKLGKFIRLVPQPVMFGFVNGLAIIIFMSQLEQFKTIVNGESVWLSGNSFVYNDTHLV